MAEQTVTSVAGANGQSGGNSLNLYPNTLLYQLTAIANDLSAAAALVTQLRTHALYRALGNPGFAINTNFDVKNANAISYVNGGTLKTLAANTNFDTGTAAVIAASKFGAALLSVDATGTGVVTWFTAAGAGYATEALAIAAITAGAATETPLGYFTVQAHASGFTAGTDALTTGAGGNVATATTYYNSVNPNSVYIGAAVAVDSITFSNGLTP